MLYLALFDAQEHTCVSHVTGEEGSTGLALYPSVLQCYGNRGHILPHFVGIDAGWQAPYSGLTEVPLPLQWTCLLLLNFEIKSLVVIRQYF